MTQEFEVTAEELVRVLQRRGIPLPSEIGAFVVLEACEKLHGRPAQLSTRDIFITEQGDVECAERPRLESEAAAASALLGVLAEVLVCAAPGVPPMLLDLVEHGPNERGLTLGLLRSDLEACLLPLNRGATRRVLSRLVREVRKAAPGTNARPLTPGADAGEVDATFDDLLGDSVPPPGAASQARARAAAAGGGERGLGLREREPSNTRSRAAAVDSRSRAAPNARPREARSGVNEWERDARERALHAAADAAEPSEPAQPAMDRAGPTPLPRAGSRAARRRASEVASGREQAEPASRARREPASEAAPDRESESSRAARDSAFRGYSSQAPGDLESASHADASSSTSPHDEPAVRRGRAADGGEARRRREPADGDDASSLRDRSNTRRGTDAQRGERAQRRGDATDTDDDERARPDEPRDGTARPRRSAADGGERLARRREDDDSRAAAVGGGRASRRDDREDDDPRSSRAAAPGESARYGRRRTDAGELSGRSRSGAEGVRRSDMAEAGDSPRPDRRRPDDSRASDPRASGALREHMDAGSSARAGSKRKGSQRPLDADSTLDAQATRGRVGIWVFMASTAAAVALLLGYFALGREQTQSALGFLKPSEHPPVKVQPPPRREYGDLRVSSKPDRAQVLLLIGPGPALATDIPVGVTQEFVAISDNYRPARALLPSDAVWDELDGQPRYELAIQARPLGDGAGNRGRATDGLGATLLPQAVGTPRGRLGSVRIVTTPRAAHVYQLIGFTPDVHVDNLPLDHPYEILVYLEGKGSVQKHIEPSDFQMQNGKRVASIDVQLSP